MLVDDKDVDANIRIIQGTYRVGETTSKELIIFQVIRPNGLQYKDRHQCIQRLSEFKVTEVIPKRFQFSKN